MPLAVEVLLTEAVARFEENFEGDEELLETLAFVKGFAVAGISGASIGFMDENKLLVLGCVGVPFSNLERTSLSIRGPSTSIEGRTDSASSSFADPNVEDVDWKGAKVELGKEEGLLVLSPFCRSDTSELTDPAVVDTPDSPFAFSDVPTFVGFADSLLTCTAGLFRFAKKFVGAFNCCT